MQKRLYTPLKLPVNYPPDFPVDCCLYFQPYRTYRDMHLHDCAEIGICLEGSGLFFIENRITAFQKGVISFVKPGDTHIAQSPNDSRSKWYFLSFVPEFFQVHDLCSRSLLFYDEDVFVLIRLLVNALLKPTPDRTLCTLLLQSAMHYISAATDVFPPQESEKDLTPVFPALQHIIQCFGEPIDIAQLASLCHLSASRFREVFRSLVGNTPMAYLTQIRMLAAADLLRESTRSVVEIAMQVGYKSLSSFHRSFQKTYDMAPLTYRKRFQSIGV